MRSTEDSAAQLDKRKRLADLSTYINTCKTIDELLPGAQMRITEFFAAERSTLYAVDAPSNQLYSLAKTGVEIKEIRVARSATSIAGFVAVARAPVNMRDVYDADELSRVHPKLRFDDRWDRASGFRTRSMMAVPVVSHAERAVIGVLQVMNRKDELPFMPRDVANAEEIARLLAVALGALNKAPRQMRQPTIWDPLVDAGVIVAEALARALAAAEAAATDPARFLVEKLGIDRAVIERALASHHNCDFHRFTGAETVPEDLRGRLRVDFLKKMCAVPIERRGRDLLVVTDDPSDLARADALRGVDPDRELALRVGFRDEILACIEHAYGLRGDVGLILKELSTDESTGAVEDPGGDDETRVADSDSAVIKLANQIIIDAFRRGASDIHVEPNGKDGNTVIRFRVDGDCVAYQEIPSAFRSPLTARFKIMAKLDISERRKPQDGKIRFRMQDRQIELRVATLPTVNGNEDVVMRILAASKPIPLDDMGMSERNLRELKKLCAKPYGLVLCVGPTGSGKTTTLHSALGHINTPDMKIWTAEDPVEITQRGLRQVQVQPKIGFDFAAAMRAFLRADPDVIMVGEMRDKETASIAVEASLTGHLVMSTLHTNSAPETVTRLIDMGLDPFSFADALLGVLAQRLARGLCGKCKVAYAATADERAAMAEALGEEAVAVLGLGGSDIKLFRGPGCEACGKTGYKGRIALHELLVNGDTLRHAISGRASVAELRRLAIEGGMTTLFEDGVEKALAGLTDLKQVLAVCSR